MSNGCFCMSAEELSLIELNCEQFKTGNKSINDKQIANKQKKTVGAHETDSNLKNANLLLRSNLIYRLLLLINLLLMQIVCIEGKSICIRTVEAGIQKRKKNNNKQTIEGKQNFIAIIILYNKKEHQTTQYVYYDGVWTGETTPRLLNIGSSINNQPMERDLNYLNKCVLFPSESSWGMG